MLIFLTALSIATCAPIWWMLSQPSVHILRVHVSSYAPDCTFDSKGLT